MTEYTDDLHARLVELDKAASPAPWVYGGGEISTIIPERKTIGRIQRNTDEVLLTTLRNALPILLARFEELSRVINMLTANGDAMFDEAVKAGNRVGWDKAADKAFELFLSEEQRDELIAANTYREEG